MEMAESCSARTWIGFWANVGDCVGLGFGTSFAVGLGGGGLFSSASLPLPVPFGAFVDAGAFENGLDDLVGTALGARVVSLTF